MTPINQIRRDLLSAAAQCEKMLRLAACERDYRQYDDFVRRAQEWSESAFRLSSELRRELEQ